VVGLEWYPCCRLKHNYHNDARSNKHKTSSTFVIMGVHQNMSEEFNFDPHW